MATGEDWSRIEVEACVAAYLQMLTLQLNGQQFSKAERVIGLIDRLDGRSKGSVEYKFRNITAVMQELGWPTVSGYKALANYQLLLLEVVEEQLQGNLTLQAAAEHAVQRPAVLAQFQAAEHAWVSRPKVASLKDPSPD